MRKLTLLAGLAITVLISGLFMTHLVFAEQSTTESGTVSSDKTEAGPSSITPALEGTDSDSESKRGRIGGGGARPGPAMRPAPRPPAGRVTGRPPGPRPPGLGPVTQRPPGRWPPGRRPVGPVGWQEFGGIGAVTFGGLGGATYIEPTYIEPTYVETETEYVETEPTYVRPVYTRPRPEVVTEETEETEEVEPEEVER